MHRAYARRGFLKAAAAAGIGLGPLAFTRAFGSNERIGVAVMGTNGRGKAHARGFAAQPGAEVVAVCDVDTRALAQAAGLVEETQGRRPAEDKDIRRILESRDVDVVSIATPNHWHAPATILACVAGKHVYVEKPCSHNAREGELMVAAARRHDRVVQMGNQRRSRETIIAAIARVRSGDLGRVYLSRSWYANTRGPTGKRTAAEVPSWLDYDLWQGPAPRRPYGENTVHYNWHWFWHWGNGELGNNGVHALDLSRWGLDVEYPVRVSSGGGRYHFEDDQETPDTQFVTYDFADGKSITWEGTSCIAAHPSGLKFGVTFHGEKGSLLLTDGGFTVYDPAGKEVENVSGSEGDAPHYEDFLACIRSGERPNADIEGGHQSTLLCHLGNIAQRTGSTLHCDPANGRIRENSAAEALWGREYERGWELKV